jgi:hypothetical protein
MLGVLVLALTGCSSPDQAEVTSAAARFTEAVAQADAEAACALLAPATRQELEQSSGSACAEAIMGEAKSAGARMRVLVYGAMAQVRYQDDTVFLSRFNDHWLVVAAACTRGPHTVHDCNIQGR